MARIKNESETIMERVLSLTLENGESSIIEKDNLELIITYSDSRAKKDRDNRERGLKRFEKRIWTGKLNKASINNRGQIFKTRRRINVVLGREKFEQDAKWDGLKGYVTNAKLSKDEILENYGHLWLIERLLELPKRI